MGTALFSFSCPILAVDDDTKPSAQASPAKKKASPSPSPKKSAQKTGAAAKHSPTPAPKTSPAAKKTETPAKKSESSDAPAPSKSKKSKAKPKPAPHKHQHAKPDSEPEKKPEKSPEPKAEPKPKPEPKQEPKPESRPAQQENRAVSQPQTAPNPPPVLPGNNLTISKSGAAQDEPAEEPEQEPPAKTRWWWPFGGGQHYKYLSRSVREAIDDAHVARHRWRYIVVHNSGTRQGSAKAFDYYHRHVRKMPNGLAYHFVIGNGTSTPDGSVEIGPRWVGQLQGGHVHSDYLNSIALGVCLVGDYNKDKPTQAQLEALDELVKYLRKRVGKTDHKLAIVKPHRDINPPQWPTDCPGDRFPYQWLSREFDDQ